jgi:NAD(P)-dependent dehydrogenase (short-subunit alcohol dehydrogenase family)
MVHIRSMRSVRIGRLVAKQAAGSTSKPRYGAFGPAKAAVISFTRQASLEWAPYGIRINGVSPGPIRDPETQWQEREPEFAKEVCPLASAILDQVNAGNRVHR